MRLFYVDSIKWAENCGADANPKEVIGLELGRKMQPQKLYIATELEIDFILQALKKYGGVSNIKILKSQVIQTLLNKEQFPVALGNPLIEENCISFDEFLKSRTSKNPLKLGIISPFGRNLGDSLMFFTTVRQYEKIAADYGRQIEIHLMNAVLPSGVRQTYEKFPLFSSIREFPDDIDWFTKVDAYINFTRSHLHYDIPWVDSLLELSGITPDRISDQAKRNCFDLDEDTEKRLDIPWKNFKSRINSPVIIFHRQSSTPIRTMPGDVYHKLLLEFLDLTDYHFISLTPVKFEHPRFTDLSHLSTDLDSYIKLISLADGFITVDTSLYHFADAFDIPGVVIYTCQPPSRFSKYYPFVKGFQIEGGEKLALKHWSNDPADIEIADALWSLLDSEMITELLKSSDGGKIFKRCVFRLKIEV